MRHTNATLFSRDKKIFFDITPSSHFGPPPHTQKIDRFVVWQIPTAGRYLITAAGASGGYARADPGNYPGGTGAVVSLEKMEKKNKQLLP